MKDVTIYTMPTCSCCKAVRVFFKEHNIAYTEHDVAVDRAKAQDMIQKSEKDSTSHAGEKMI